MEVKQTEMEIFKTKKTYYDDLRQSRNDSNSFWNIFLILCTILILIIIFIIVYYYIYGKIIYICTRCFTWRNTKSNNDDKFSVIKGESDCSKRRFLWPNNWRNISKSHIQFNNKNDKLHETKSYQFKTPLQEKEKLLSSCEDKIITSNNIDLTKRLFLKLSILSCPTNNKDALNHASTNWNIQNLKKFSCNELHNQKAKNYQNLHKDEKSICFSDTDLKFLVIPTSSKKFNIINKNRNEKILLYKWNSENTNHNVSNNTSSKLIEIQCEDKNSIGNDKKKYGVSTSKSNCSPFFCLPNNLTTDSFSDSAANKSDILPNLFLKNLKRSTNSYTSSTISGASNTTEAKSEDSPMHVANNITESEIEVLQELNVHSKRITEKMKSSVDILSSQIKEVKNPERKVKSEENFTFPAISTENAKNRFILKKHFISIPEKYIESPSTPLDHNTEKSEIYDELGMLISQYMKLQIQPCRRKYCSRSRRLKRIQHSIRKCRTRFNRIYPFDQRPTCNSGNVCVDTYDELKLMLALPSEWKNIYRYMFKRRKQFLNQPCILINQDIITDSKL